MSDSDLYIRFIPALLFVLGLIMVAAWALRRFGPAGRIAASRGRKRLAIVEVTAIDTRRRLVLVRRDEREHLLLIGGPNDLLLESGGPAATGFGDHLAEARGG